MAVLGSLEYVNSLLNQRDAQYAREYLDYILPESLLGQQFLWFLHVEPFLNPNVRAEHSRANCRN